MTNCIKSLINYSIEQTFDEHTWVVSDFVIFLDVFIVSSTKWWMLLIDYFLKIIDTCLLNLLEIKVWSNSTRNVEWSKLIWLFFVRKKYFFNRSKNSKQICKNLSSIKKKIWIWIEINHIWITLYYYISNPIYLTSTKQQQKRRIEEKIMRWYWS